jgi:hypothetical protein
MELTHFGDDASFPRALLEDLIQNLWVVARALEHHGDELHALVVMDVAEHLEKGLSRPGPG